MQPTSSGVNTPPQIDRSTTPNRVSNEDSAATIRVDAPPDPASFIKAPHGPLGTPGARPGRVRGERPKPQEAPSQSAPNESEAAGSNAPLHRDEFRQAQNASTQRLDEHHDSQEASQELNWGVLHAEDIARVLDQRLFEIERRERLLNRRANQISQQERMFRLWANDTRQELERKRRELQQLESDLIQRGHDLRWLLVHGDQFDSVEKSLPGDMLNDDYNLSSKPRSGRVPAQKEGGSLEEELKNQIEEMEFGSSSDGMRRPGR